MHLSVPAASASSGLLPAAACMGSYLGQAAWLAALKSMLVALSVMVCMVAWRRGCARLWATMQTMTDYAASTLFRWLSLKARFSASGGNSKIEVDDD